ncbi:protein angel homolog 1 [Pangasianodon hypophthalmus]|uniref:protein angel homolog 1 n=1 Tax=Pangasianodon hypophthalmus TaxID=310915 RepID=UPI0023070905|nr:protein angel homolog 1 [Pangasianodon hypophthalmus]
MIGSLIYYGLYPLTQLFIRLSDSWWKRHPVIIHGKAVCDGGARSCRRLNEQQAALLDEWCNAGPEASETPTCTQRERREAEGLVESRPLLEITEVVVEQKSELEEDKEKICSADLMDPNPESVMEWAKIQTAADESKWKFSSEEERQRFQGMVTEAGGVCPFMPAGGFSCHLGSYKAAPSSTLTHAGSGNHGLLKSLQESQACANGNESFEPTADGAEESEIDGSKVPVQLTSALFTTDDVYADDLFTRGSEAQASNGSLVYDLSALLADNHAPSFNHTWLQPTPTGWHFPVGPGLSEVVYHPLQFPGTSYYQGFQENTNFEVVWRVWEDLGKTSSPCVSPHTACVDPGSKFDFTIMSYNILAQDLLEANSELYAHCSENVLAWENRLENILKELQTWEPDIICLQEVQENHFQEQMYPALIEMGYDCVYKRRTGNKTDGCAVCYNTKCFTQLSVRLLEFQRHECELLDRDNVGIVLLLQPTTAHGDDTTFRPICVANTHLLFNPRRGDVKLAQLAIMLAEIDSMVRQCKVKGRECEIILCGDFNSLPNMPLYQLIVTGQLYYHGLPNWMVSGQEDLSYKTHHRRLYAPLWPSSLGISDNCRYYDIFEPEGKESGKLQYNHDFLRQLRYCPAACVRPPDLELIPGVTDNTPTPEETQPIPPRHFRNTICHGFNLSSVYSQNISGTECCAVTTLHSHGAAMVDYIFYSARREHTTGCDDKEKGLKLLGRLALLSEADLWLLNGLPNEIFPSDHLSLLAKFQLC